jgi:hypothetical protein
MESVDQVSAGSVGSSEVTRVEPTGLGYLDDPNHVWEIDPDCTRDVVSDIEHLYENRAEDSVTFVLEGFAGLRKRHPEASVEECLGTAMMWWFG